MPAPAKKKRKIDPARVNCDYCGKDVTAMTYISCCQCEDLDFCVDCFFVGAEVKDHKSNHKYQVHDFMATKLFGSEWVGGEEYLLMEGVMKFGLGNWTQVSQHVITKSAAECEYHYWMVYIDNMKNDGGSFLPPEELAECPNDDELTVPYVACTDPSVVAKRAPNLNIERNLHPKMIVEPYVVTKNDVEKDDQGIMLSVLKAKGEKPMVTDCDRSKLKPHVSEIGYNPLRRSFATQYFHDAEEYIGHVELKDDDTDEVKRLKERMIKTYANIMRDRLEREKFVHEHGLHKQSFLSTSHFKDSRKRKLQHPEKYELHKYRPFVRFCKSKSEYDKFISLIKTEMELRKEIRLYKLYRKNGIKSKIDVKRYESEKRRRDAAYGNTRKRNLSTFDVEEYDGYKLLSDYEKELCQEIKIQPNQFMVIKELMVRENFKLGGLNKAAVENMLRTLDAQKVDRIFEYLVDCHWIREMSRR